MGTDKAFLRLAGLTLLEHAIMTANQVCETVALVGDKERLHPYGWIVEDKFPGQGPLAGIQAALTSSSAGQFSLVLAVDTPAISAELLKYLFKEAMDHDALVTVPRAGGHLQTLCGIYRPGFAEIAELALREGRNKIDPLFRKVPVRVIEEDTLKALGFPPDIFDNVNTPEDWQRIQQRLGASHS